MLATNTLSESAMRLLHPTRRSFLAGASALSMAGVVRPALAQSPSLVVAPRQIEVLGRAATVYGITGPDGKPGLRAREGDRFTGQVQNDTDAGLVMHWHGQIFAPEGADRAYPGGGETPAGAADTVDFALTPGTHWMHSHQMTEQLLLAGSMMHGGGAMAGMDHSQMGHGSGAGSGGETMMTGMVHANDVAYDAFLANDRTLSDPEVVTVDPASTLRLRIINGATASAFWIDAGALPSQVIAVD